LKHLVVLTGAGISAESGIPTFRGSDGLWEGHDIMDVASPKGWQKNPSLVLEFYNLRRKKALEVQPNDGHRILAELEGHFKVTVITQNVDNLHERAGSTDVLHLHGSLFESRSTEDEALVYPIEGWELKLGDTCELGSQLRPNIVWFGEAVPLFEPAMLLARKADVFLVVGTSLQVYPAAGLLEFVPYHAQRFVVDPKIPEMRSSYLTTFVEDVASSGLKKIYSQLLTLA